MYNFPDSPEGILLNSVDHVKTLFFILWMLFLIRVQDIDDNFHQNIMEIILAWSLSNSNLTWFKFNLNKIGEIYINVYMHPDIQLPKKSATYRFFF